MMIRLLHLMSMLAMIAAGGFLVSCGLQWTGAHDPVTRLSALAEARQSGAGVETRASESVSPLMGAAQGFSSYLNPPPPPVRAKPVVQEAPNPVAPPVRPSAASPKVKVRGTICAGPSQRSIALIWEPGAKGAGRWVREGTQVGHFVIHEIRAGSVVFLDGERLCEMAVEREPSPATVVAEGGPSTASNSPTTVGSARPAETTGRPRRSSGGRLTVGSARTSTLD